MAETALSVKVTGRVQGVWFRAWTREEAERLGVSGWVRNAADGSVEAHLEGPKETVAAMVEALRRGPPAARVTDVETAPAEANGAEGFRVEG